MGDNKIGIEDLRIALGSLDLQKGSIIPHSVIALYAGTDGSIPLTSYSFKDGDKYKLALLTVADTIYKELGLLTKIHKNRVVIQRDNEAVDHEYYGFRLVEAKMYRKRERYSKIDEDQLTNDAKCLKEAREKEMVMKLQYLRRASEDLSKS
jgi:hypothetical protein